MTSESVYLTAGAALPYVITNILESLLNESFEKAYNNLLEKIIYYGYALADIVRELFLKVTELILPDQVLSCLVDKLSTIEFRLSHGVSEKLQIGALVGAFTVARSMMQT